MGHPSSGSASSHIVGPRWLRSLAIFLVCIVAAIMPIAKKKVLAGSAWPVRLVLALTCWVLSPVWAAPFAYVANKESRSVSVIDVATNLVTQTVAFGTRPNGLAVSPSGARVYVTLEGRNTGVINTAAAT